MDAVGVGTTDLRHGSASVCLHSHLHGCSNGARRYHTGVIFIQDDTHRRVLELRQSLLLRLDDKVTMWSELVSHDTGKWCFGRGHHWYPAFTASIAFLFLPLHRGCRRWNGGLKATEAGCWVVRGRHYSRLKLPRHVEVSSPLLRYLLLTVNIRQSCHWTLSYCRLRLCQLSILQLSLKLLLDVIHFQCNIGPNNDIMVACVGLRGTTMQYATCIDR